MPALYDSLAGRIVIVTGAAGILGSEIVSQLLFSRAIVCAVDLDISILSKKLGSTEGLFKFQCDVSVPSQVDELVGEIEDSIGPVYALYNNAATKTSNLDDFFGRTLDYNLETWERVLDVNLKGMYLMARSVITHMAVRKEGSIVQTASIYGATMGPDHRIYEGSQYLGKKISSPVVYTVSKAGVHGLTNHLATEFGHRAIRVNTLTPGGIRSGQNPEFEAKYSARVPLGRMATVDEIAAVGVFLATNEAKYLTGQNIFVDGGLSSW
jgi:NAD(P)-dependent dehydrogenase (short-subunit alcohol dehydrogenase family)